MLVRWGLDEIASLLSDLEVSAPLVVSTERWRELELPGRRFDGARPYAEVEGVRKGVRAAAGTDVLVAVGGGSTLDTAKGISAESDLPLVSVPTTYSGSEWTPFYGMRDAAGKKLRGSGAHPVAIVYEPGLTLGLPVEITVGSAMNALNHCAEALYVKGRSGATDERALDGAMLIAKALPTVVGAGRDLRARRDMLEGAMLAGSAMVEAGRGLGHAMAQALGGRFDVPHGAANALCLAPALRFNQAVSADAISRFGNAIGSENAVRAVVSLAERGGFRRLRDFWGSTRRAARGRRSRCREAGGAHEPASGESRGSGGALPQHLVDEALASAAARAGLSRACRLSRGPVPASHFEFRSRNRTRR